MSRRLRKFACFFILVSSCFAGETEWVEVRSPHFSVVTNAGEKRGREVALRFEQMRSVFGTLMAKAKVNLPVPMQIVAFRNTKDMKEYVPLWKGRPTQLAGLFEGNDDRTFIMLDLSVDDPWQVVFHEYAHQLLNGNTSAQFQPWFDEGFAEFFSSIKVNGKEADVGLPSDRNYQVLQQAGMVKVADLFRVQRNSSTYNESGDHRSMFYAESWLVVHYLFDKQLISKLGLYFDLTMVKHQPVEESIQQAFGTSASDLDLALKQYLKADRFLYYKLPAPPGIESAGYNIKPMGPLDAQAVLADMHLHSPDFHDKARAEFEEVLKTQPDNAAALRGLGYSYLMERDFPEAAEYFRRAVEHDSQDPRVLYYSALMIEMQEGPGLGNDQQELDVIQKRLEKAVQLDPEFADAYCRLAFTYVSQGKADLALTTMMKAMSLNPRSQAYALNLAEMYLFNGKVDQALALLEPLQPLIEPRFAAPAAQLLDRARAAKQGTDSGAQIVLHTRPRSESQSSPNQMAAGAADVDMVDSEVVPQTPASARFLRGKLMAVDCSIKPEAVFTVISGATTWKFHARDATRVIVIGADNLSCDWSNRKVAINYHQTGEATGEVISVELQ